MMTVTLDGLSMYETRSESRDEQPTEAEDVRCKGRGHEPNKWKNGLTLEMTRVCNTATTNRLSA